MYKKNFLFLVLILSLAPLNGLAQSATSATLNLKGSRTLHQNILKTVKNTVKEKYYDANLRGIDIEANAAKANELINAANSVEEMDDIIARFLYPFDDSHLFFLPPSNTIKVEYGWEMRFIGDKVFVTKVEENSDAKKKNVRVGDQIYMIEGYIPTRQEFSLLRYHFNILRPQPALNVIVIKPNGNKYKVELKAKVTEDDVFMPDRRDLQLQAEREYQERTEQLSYDKIPGVFIWKMPSFELSRIKVDKMMDKVGKNDALILDLRGNGGGYVSSLGELVSHFFDKVVKLGVVKERKESKTLIVEPHSKKNFAGKLIVLTDSDSGSAAEIFARLMQIEKRGTVLGDQSAGAVMQARVFYETFGLDSKVPYGVSVTVSDWTMMDGQRLEKTGVTPDEKILPTAQDMANRRDPVMARALKILGIEQTPEQAGAIFPEEKK